MTLSERIEDEEDVKDVKDIREQAESVGDTDQAMVAQTATRTLRVMSYNVLAGGWPRIDALEAVMRAARADIIGLQEVRPHTLTELASRLDMRSELGPSREGSSVGLLSRWPLRSVHPHSHAPLANALLEAVIEPEGSAPLRIFVAHLSAGYTAWRAGEGKRLRELAYILDRMRATSGADAGQILMGDFNSLPPDERLLATQLLLHTARNDVRRAQGDDLKGQPGVHTVLPAPVRPVARALLGAARLPALAWVCDLVAGAYVPRAVVRQTRMAGFTDLYTVTHPDPQQREMSCPSTHPAGRIDYIFASPSLAAGLASCDLLSDAPGCPVSQASDHRPMLAALTLPARA